MSLRKGNDDHCTKCRKCRRKSKIFLKNYINYMLTSKIKNIDNGTMSVLSMGMTGDFEVAVEEGATMIRVGTGIFGSRWIGEN